MAFQREWPQSFNDALQVSRQILNTNSELVSQGVVDTEAEQLVLAAYRHATGLLLSRLELFARIADRFPDAAGERLLITAGSRAEGKPLQYLTGYQFFLNHEYEVGPEVLIPRPETEVLAMVAIEELRSLEAAPVLGLEIGVGSGILSIELLAHYSHLKILASELTPLARGKALKNARNILGAGPRGEDRLQIELTSGPLDIWGPFEKLLKGRKAEFLMTNPPYLLREGEAQPQVLMYEPAEALFAPPQDPLYFYRALAEKAPQVLQPKGFVFAEMPHERAQEVVELFAKPTWETKSLLDLNQRNRVLVARLN